jgi:maleylpyruvate isomerase
VKLVLHNYWRSSASYRVRIGLHLKQLPFEYQVVNILKRDQFSADYRAKNGMQQVPTLVITEDDGTTLELTQSLPILEYLDERFPGTPLMPKDPLSRARARILAEIVNSGIQPLQNLSVLGAVKALGADNQVWARGYIDTGLGAFETAVHDTAGQFCVGDAVSIADIVLVPQLAAARRFGTDVARFERLVEIETRCTALQAFKNAAPDQQPDAVK